MAPRRDPIMQKKDTLSRLIDVGVIPIVRIADAEKSVRIVDALLLAGLPGSLAVIEKIAKRFGTTLFLGAGTVLNQETVRRALSAGAQYIVSPNTNPAVISACKKASVPVFPGALTPTEISMAKNAGVSGIKVFPCNAMGGPDYIRALLAPFPDAVLFPCGGVDTDNAEAYLRAGAAGLFTGASIISSDIIKTGRYTAITVKAKRLLSIISLAREKKP
jgi:2-dehydro-3-deoxyphosphogluconate aldolase/(4S)-4-hydroxy-2-oxoglutarate aldolase